jgi:hypothetical protein
MRACSKSGRTSAPRWWPQTWQTNCGSRSDSRTSSGRRSALIAVEWLQMTIWFLPRRAGSCSNARSSRSRADGSAMVRSFGSGYQPFAAAAPARMLARQRMYERQAALLFGDAGGVVLVPLVPRVGVSEEAAIGVDESDLVDGGGCEPEPTPRSEAEDLRICIHESGHAIAARLLGNELGDVTAQASAGLSGLCWGPNYFSRFAESDGDAPSLCEKLGPLMPGPGESRANCADVTQHCHTRLVELCAGSVAEELFLDGPPWDAVDDRKQERALAALVASSPTAIEAFIGFCAIEAAALLKPNAHLVRALAVATRTRRTLTGVEVDEVIAAAVAAKSIEDERRRHADSKRAEQSASMPITAITVLGV